MHIRFHKHLYGGYGSQPLWNAVHKYGLDNFAFLVIDEIPEFTSDNNQELLDLETKYILKYGDYNILTEAGNTIGYIHTEATRKSMRENYSDERRKQIASLNRGKTPSPATIELMRQAALARSPMSKETRDKVSSNSAKAMLYELTTLTGTALGSSIVLRTIPTVSEYCACDEKTVRRALKGNGIIKRKWSIKTLGPAK
jgi:group I intron endonuclease